jgi:hypothetical protein
MNIFDIDMFMDFMEIIVRPQSIRSNSFARLGFICSFVHLFICSFVHLFICSFVHLFICSFVHLFICSFVHLFVCSFVHLFVCSFVHWFICSFVHLFICSFVHLFICSFVHLFICSFVHLFICSPLKHACQHMTRLQNIKNQILLHNDTILGKPCCLMQHSCLYNVIRKCVSPLPSLSLSSHPHIAISQNFLRSKTLQTCVHLHSCRRQSFVMSVKFLEMLYAFTYSLTSRKNACLVYLYMCVCVFVLPNNVEHFST